MGREAITAAGALIHYPVGVVPSLSPINALWRAVGELAVSECVSEMHSTKLLPTSGLAQGSDTVELGFSTVLILPNFARRSHNTDVSGGIEQFLFSTHKVLEFN
jgi:hypothetical protein